MTLWISQVSSFKCNNVKVYQLWHDVSVRLGQIIIFSIEIQHQLVNSLGGRAGIAYTVGIFYYNLTVLWLLIWGGGVTVSITTICQHTLCFNFNIKNLLYINCIHSYALKYRTTWRCCIYLSRITYSFLPRHISIETILVVPTSSPGTSYVVSKAYINSLTFTFNVLERLLILSLVGPTLVTV